MSAIQILKTKHKLPIDELWLGDGGYHTDVSECVHIVLGWRLTQAEYHAHIAELLDYKDGAVVTGWEHPKMAHYVFAYLVQLIVEDYTRTEISNIDSLYLTAITKAQKFIKTHDWVFNWELTSNAEPKLDAAGNVQPAKGDKKVMAKKVWNDNQGKNLTRKEWIELLMKEVGLTSGGASTYHNNLKNGIY
jgi:hypothetical protein